MDPNEAQGRRLLERQALPREVVSAAWELARSRGDIDLCGVLQEQGHLNPAQVAAIRREAGALTGRFDPSQLAGPAAPTPGPDGLIRPAAPPATGSPQTGSYDSGQIPRATGSYDSGQIPRATGSYDSGQIPRATGSYDSGQIPRATGSPQTGGFDPARIAGAGTPPPQTGRFDPGQVTQGPPQTGRFDPNALQSSFETGSSGGSAYVSGGIAAVGPTGHTSAMMNSNVSDTGGGRLVTGGIPELIDRLVEEGLPNVEVTGELGRGGMGVVLEGKDRSLGIDVVVKVMLTADASPDALMRFQREARSLARVDHPGIVKVRELSEFEGYPYFVMERVNGEDLMVKFEAAIADTGTPPELDMVLPAIASTARALDAAHREQILHRDVKPANIILENGTGRAVLVDFGLAKAQSTEAKQALDDTMAELTKSADIIGTPAYMAPEQLDRSGEFGVQGPCTDLWGIAATLYLLVSGETPYRGATMANIFKAVLTADPPRATTHRADLPEWLDDLLATCLQRQADKRPSLTTFAECLEARSLEPLGDTAPPVDHRKTLRYAAIAAAVLLLIGVLAGIRHVTRPLPPPTFKIVDTKSLGRKSFVVTEATGTEIALRTGDTSFKLPLQTHAPGYDGLEVKLDGNARRYPLKKGGALVELQLEQSRSVVKLTAIDWLGRAVPVEQSLVVILDREPPTVRWGPLPESSLKGCRLTGVLSEPSLRPRFALLEESVEYSPEDGRFSFDPTAHEALTKPEDYFLFVTDLVGNEAKIRIPVRVVDVDGAGTHSTLVSAMDQRTLPPRARIFLRPIKPDKPLPTKLEDKIKFSHRMAVRLEHVEDIELIGEVVLGRRPRIAKGPSDDFPIMFELDGGLVRIRDVDLLHISVDDKKFVDQQAGLRKAILALRKNSEADLPAYFPVALIKRGELHLDGVRAGIRSDVPDAVPFIVGRGDASEGPPPRIRVTNSMIEFRGQVLHGFGLSHAIGEFRNCWIHGLGQGMRPNNTITTNSLILARSGSEVRLEKVSLRNGNASVKISESRLDARGLSISKPLVSELSLDRSSAYLTDSRLVDSLMGTAHASQFSRLVAEDCEFVSVGNAQNIAATLYATTGTELLLRRCKVRTVRGETLRLKGYVTLVAENCQFLHEPSVTPFLKAGSIQGYEVLTRPSQSSIVPPFKVWVEDFWQRAGLVRANRQGCDLTLRSCRVTDQGRSVFALATGSQLIFDSSLLTVPSATGVDGRYAHILAQRSSILARNSRLDVDGIREHKRSRPGPALPPAGPEDKLRGRSYAVVGELDESRLEQTPKVITGRVPPGLDREDLARLIGRLRGRMPTRTPIRLLLEPGRHRFPIPRSLTTLELVGAGKAEDVVLEVSDRPLLIAARNHSVRFRNLTLRQAGGSAKLEMIHVYENAEVELENVRVEVETVSPFHVSAFATQREGLKVKGRFDGLPRLRLRACTLVCRGATPPLIIDRGIFECDDSRFVCETDSKAPFIRSTRVARLRFRGTHFELGARPLLDAHATRILLETCSVEGLTARPAIDLKRSTLLHDKPLPAGLLRIGRACSLRAPVSLGQDAASVPPEPDWLIASEDPTRPGAAAQTSKDEGSDGSSPDKRD